ncbi:MAG TPA: M12 family metallo-peptidase [Flavobacterium sp.]|uniref:M12 family metallo-peptidase n=1 Tax=Flavobacterium sp. TaxID=239 RepID=UPI002C282CED|nr:M12 family metallo-peptidase [Flavobacterium sp.]HNP33158.1 M12 family metallo-peptidase [Flavobacterium sp.]
MKKNLLLSTLFCLTNLIAQNKVAEKVSELQKLRADFIPISVLSPTQNVIDSDVNKVVDGATLATLNIEKINSIVANKYDYIELKIPYQNQDISVLLYKVNPFAEGFHVDTNRDKNIAYEKGVYYRGIIKGETNSVSAFNFFNGEFNGIISDSELGNVVVGKLEKPNNHLDYIVYSDAKMKVLNDFDCHVKNDGTNLPKTGIRNRSINSTRCVAFYFEIDNTLFQQNGSNTTTTTNWMTSVFNNVQTLYNNDGITVGLKSIFIWESADPYEGIATSSGPYLSAFASNTPVFDGDAGMLVGIDPGGLGGVAYLNTLCESNNYAYADVNFTYNTVPTYSWTVQVITHEFGHSLGSSHTHDCVWNGNNTRIDGCGPSAGYPGNGTCAAGPIPSAADKGTIMSYCHLVSGVGISLSNGFGPQPAALILNNVNNSTCLSFDCIHSCPNTILDMTVSSITPTSANVTWTEGGSATSWEVAVRAFSSSSSLVWNTVTTNTYAMSGLSPNTYYVVYVRPLCTDIEPALKQQIFATSAPDFCAGVSFTDTGGTSGNYTNMESWVRTMTPNNAGLKMKVTFSSFNLELNYDYLYIYNGPDEFSGDLTSGGLTGSTNPGVYNSTSSEGSLTFKFYSDEGVVAAGWNATISCTGTLGVGDADFLDYSYYPNPTTGKVAITSKDAITEVAVYNVQGQLLYNQKINALNTNVDISQFATGTYFFKLKINDREANFKIVKM